MYAEELSRKDCLPSSAGQYPSLENKMKDGKHVIHGFRSGGGLRVVRLEKCKKNAKRGELIFYGEHPYVYNALDYLEEDCAAGGQDYNKVYGKIHDHYLTGAYPVEGRNFDRYAYAGNGFDIFYQDNEFVFESEYSDHDYFRCPDDVTERVIANYKAARLTGISTGDFPRQATLVEKFKIDEFEFEVQACVFANGAVGTSHKCLNPDPKDNCAHLWKKVKVRISAPTITELIVKLDKELVLNERN